MKSKVAKLKAVDAWGPTRDDPLSGRWRKSSQRCSWRLCPQMSAEERRQRFAEFGKESQAEFRAADAADTTLLRCADFFKPS